MRRGVGKLAAHFDRNLTLYGVLIGYKMGELTFGIILFLTVSGARAQTFGVTGPGLEVLAKPTVTEATSPAPPTNADNTAAASQDILNRVLQTKRQNAFRSIQRINGHSTDPSSQEPSRKYGTNKFRQSQYQADSTRSQLLPRSRLAMRNKFYRKFQAFLLANLAARANATRKASENRLKGQQSQPNEQEPMTANSKTPTLSEKIGYNQNQDAATPKYASSLSPEQSKGLSSDQTTSAVLSTQTLVNAPSSSRPHSDLVSNLTYSKLTSVVSPNTNNKEPLKTKQTYPTENSVNSIPKFELVQNVPQSETVSNISGTVPSVALRAGTGVQTGQFSEHDFTRSTLVEEPYYDWTSTLKGSTAKVNTLEKEPSTDPLVLSGAVAGLSQSTALSSSPTSSSSSLSSSAATLSTSPSLLSSPTFMSGWKTPAKDSTAYKLLTYIIKPSMLGAASIKQLQAEAKQKSNTHRGNRQQAAIKSTQDTAAYHVAPVTYKSTVGEKRKTGTNVLASQQSPRMYQFLLTVKVPSDVRQFSLNTLPNMIFDTSGNQMTHEDANNVNPASNVFVEATSTKMGGFEGSIAQKGRTGQIRKITNLNSANFRDQTPNNIARQHSQKMSGSKTSYESNKFGIANIADVGFTGGHPQSIVTLGTTEDATGYVAAKATPKVFESPVGGSYQLKTDIGGMFSNGLKQYKPNVAQFSGRLASELSGLNKKNEKNLEMTQLPGRIYQPNTNTIQLSGGVTLQNTILAQDSGGLTQSNSQISQQSRGISQSSSQISKQSEGITKSNSQILEQLEGLTQKNSNTLLPIAQLKNEYKSDILSKKGTNRMKTNQGFDHQKAPKVDTTLIQETGMLLNNVIKPQPTDHQVAELSLATDVTQNTVSKKERTRQASPIEYVKESNQLSAVTSYTNGNNMNEIGYAQGPITANNPKSITEKVPITTVDSSTPTDAGLDAFFRDLAQYVGESSKRLRYLVFLKRLVDAELNSLSGQSTASETDLIGSTSQVDSMAAVPSSTVFYAPAVTSVISSSTNPDSQAQTSSTGLNKSTQIGTSSNSFLQSSKVYKNNQSQTLTEGTGSKRYVNNQIGSAADAVFNNYDGSNVAPDSYQSITQPSGSFTADKSQVRTSNEISSAFNERVYGQQFGSNQVMSTTDAHLINNPGAITMLDSYQPLPESNTFVTGDITQHGASQETRQTLNRGALGLGQVINQGDLSADAPMVGNAGSYAALDSYQFLSQSTGPVVGDMTQSADPLVADITQSVGPIAADITQSVSSIDAYIAQQVGPIAADITQPVAPITTDITQPVGPIAADITLQVGPIATDITQPAGPIAADITQPVGPIAAYTTKSVGPNVADITQSVSPSAAEISQSVDPIAADITQAVAPIATDKTQPVRSITAYITQPIGPIAADITTSTGAIAADITQSVGPISVDTTQPVAPTIADITKSSEYISADVIQPVSPVTADMLQMRASKQTGINGRIVGKSFGNNDIALPADAIDISSTGSSAVLDSYQPSFEIVGPGATDITHIGASNTPAQTLSQGNLGQSYMNDQLASSADAYSVGSVGSNAALNSYQYSSQSSGPISADVAQVRGTQETGQIINEGILDQSYVNNQRGSASDAVMTSVGTNTVIESYQIPAQLNDPVSADTTQVRAVQETGQIMNEGNFGKQYVSNKREPASDNVMTNIAGTNAILDSYQTPAQLNGPVPADITQVRSTQQTDQVYDKGTLGTNYANNQIGMASDAVMTNSAGTNAVIDSYKTPAQLNGPVPAENTQVRRLQQTGHPYNDVTIGQRSGANQMASTAEAVLIGNAKSSAAVNSPQLSSQINGLVTAYITQPGSSNKLATHSNGASSIQSQKLMEIERSLSWRFPARAAASPGGRCRLLDVCGRDGFTYISECLLSPSIGKACKGKCPCPVVNHEPPSNVEMTGVNNVLQDFLTYLKGTMAVASNVDGTAAQHPPPKITKTFGYQKLSNSNQPAHVSIANGTPGYQTSQIISLTLNQSSSIDVNTNGNQQPTTLSSIGNSLNSNGYQMQSNIPGQNLNEYQMQKNIPGLNIVTSHGNQALGGPMVVGNQISANGSIAGQQATLLNICVNRCPQMYSPVCAASGVIYANECFLKCGRDRILCPGPCPCEYEVLPPAERQKLVATYSSRATLAGMDPMEFAEVAWTEERCACAATDKNFVCTSFGSTITQCASQCSGQPIKCKGKCPCK